MLTITVDEMPAKSIVLLQLVMTRAGVAEDGTPLDVHIAGWVHGTLADCPVYPVEPSRNPSMCVAGETVLPTINVPAIENSTYGEPVYPGVNEHERTVNLTATANAGCVFPQPADGGVIAPGWHWIDERTVEYRRALALVYCEPAIVELPVTEPSMCTNGAVTAPAFAAPADSASVTYSEPVTAETGAGVTSAEPTKAADAPVTKLPSTGTGAGNGTSMLITGALGAMAIAMLASGVIRSQKQRS